MSDIIINFYKNIYIPKPTENIINEDKYYIYLKNKIYSKTQEKYLCIIVGKKLSTKKYSTLVKACYDPNNPHMTLKKNNVYYHYDI